MKYIKCIVLLFLLTYSHHGIAQQYSENQINHQITESSKYLESDPQWSIKKFLKIYVQSKEIDYQRGMMLSNINIAKAYNNLDVLEKVIEYASRAEKQAKELNDYECQIEAIRYQAISQLELKNYGNAEKMVKEALHYPDKIKDNDISYKTKAALYQSLSTIFYKNEDISLDSAVYYNRKCIAIYNKVSSALLRNQYLDAPYINLGQDFLEMEQLDSAEYYINKGLKLAKINNSKFTIIQALGSLGNLYYDKKQYKKAIDYYNQGITHAKKYKNTHSLKYLYYDISEAYEALNNSKKATEYTSKYRKMTDSLENAQRESMSSIMKVIVEDKEEKSKQTLLKIIGVIIILSLILFIVFRLIQLRHKRKKAIETERNMQQLEYKALKSQMNPHFVFNVLNNMQGMMILKGEQEVNKYFVAFSRLLRSTLDISNKEQISLSEEVDYIKNYLMLNSLQFNEDLKYSINIDENIKKTTDIFLPGMLIQPFIENAIIHGLTPKLDDKKIEIKFYLEENYLIATIEDNGIGREASAELSKNRKYVYKSWSTTIVNERIKIINSDNKNSVSIAIEDLIKDEKPSGTKVTLRFKIL